MAKTINKEEVTSSPLFTIDHVNFAAKAPLEDAKATLCTYIDEHSGIKPVTAFRAKRMVQTAKNRSSLAIALSNWILAHPREGLKSL